MNTIAERNVLGTRETNGLVNGQAYHSERVQAREVPWTESGLRITRLRLVSDRGHPVWDVSYCDGEIRRGGNVEKVAVRLPFSQIPKVNFNGFLLMHAKHDRVYAKGLGLFDLGVISKLI